MRSIAVTAVLVSLVNLASPQSGLRINPGERSNRGAEYRQVVANYCRLDYDGARLTEQGWPRIQPMTSWHANPEFKRVAVVTRYQILPDMHSDHGRYSFDVDYDVSGDFDLSSGYFPDPNHIIVHIELGDSNGDARVMDTSEQRPFVGQARFLQWLKARLAAETDPVAKATLEASLQRFQEQSKKPDASQ